MPFFDKTSAANTSEGGAQTKPPRPAKTEAQKADIRRRWNTRVSTNRHGAALETIAADFADVPSIAFLGGKVSGRIAAGADPSEVDALMARLRHKIEVKKAWEERRELNRLYPHWTWDDYAKAVSNVRITEEQYVQVWRRERRRGHPLGYIQTWNSSYINKDLRKGVLLKGDNRRTVRTLDVIIEDNTLPKGALLYRYEDDAYIKFLGCNSRSTSEIVDYLNSKAGTVLSDPGFKSTSCVEGWNVFSETRNVRINIRAKKGAHAFVTHNKPESEVILPRGSRLKLVSARSLVRPYDSNELIVIDCDLL